MIWYFLLSLGTGANRPSKNQSRARRHLQAPRSRFALPSQLLFLLGLEFRINLGTFARFIAMASSLCINLSQPLRFVQGAQTS